jgi:hypothetical protein
MEKKELKKILAGHKEWLLDSPTGKRANLHYANLTGADLTDADLTYANLHGANLSGANLTDADLTDADLTGANLSGANLTYAGLSGANLSDAGLSGANLDFASWSLSCKSLHCVIDEKIFNQLLYHALKICPDTALKNTAAWKVFAAEANKFHRIGEGEEIK